MLLTQATEQDGLDIPYLHGAAASRNAAVFLLHSFWEDVLEPTVNVSELWAYNNP